MQLIIHDRRPVPTTPTGEALLTIERKGSFSLTIAAVAALGLRPTDEVVLAQDAATNAWFLILDPSADMEGFELRPRDRSAKALMFCSQPRARAYYQAHGLSQETSVRSLVSATAVEHQGIKLYPLTPQHATRTPQVVTAVEPAAVASPVPVAEQPAQPDVMPLDTDLPHLQPEQPATPPMVASTPVPVSSVPVLTPGQLPESRGEQLADYWNECEIGTATPDELEEVLKVLGAMPRSDRGFTENKVLNQAKTEQAKRVKEAGKKGGKRG
jgi:hypothetical protein